MGDSAVEGSIPGPGRRGADDAAPGGSGRMIYVGDLANANDEFVRANRILFVKEIADRAASGTDPRIGVAS
jgi:hypothetical protein